MNEHQESTSPELTSEHVRDLLYSFSTGTFCFGELTESIRYVLDDDSQLIVAITPGARETPDSLLFIPDETYHAPLELLVTPEPIDSEIAEVDRWRIYHGSYRDLDFARLIIEAIKYKNEVYDGESLAGPNPLFKPEPGLCREFNQEHKESLGPLCRHFTGIDPSEPVMVGISPTGFDIRAPFGIIRVNAIERFESADHAREILAKMIMQATSTEG